MCTCECASRLLVGSRFGEMCHLEATRTILWHLRHAAKRCLQVWQPPRLASELQTILGLLDVQEVHFGASPLAMAKGLLGNASRAVMPPSLLALKL